MRNFTCEYCLTKFSHCFHVIRKDRYYGCTRFLLSWLLDKFECNNFGLIASIGVNALD